MLKIKNYVRVKTLEEAYLLNQEKGSVILGGMLWLKMSNRTVKNAIDLMDLGLDTIEETEDEIRLGCQVTLRQMETHPGFLAYTRGACREAVRHIVGVQFRNLATVGGSLFGRYGFSDVMTFFMALDAEVELYHGGRMPISQFAASKKDRDILVRVIVKKVPMRMAYLTQRNTKTDFPVLACAVSMWGDTCRAVIGARPGLAVCFTDENKTVGAGTTAEDFHAFAEAVASQVKLQSNMRASEEYRRHLTKVLIRRCGAQIAGQEETTC